MKERVLRASRFLGFLVPVVFAALLALKEAGWPNADFGARGASRTAIVVLAFSTVGAALAGWFAEILTRRSLRRERLREDLEDVCRLSVHHVLTKCRRVSVDQLGAHVWLVPRRWWRRSGKGPELERGAMFSILGRPKTPIRWTKGTGAIGMAWRDVTPFFVNLDEAIWERARGGDDAEFDSLASDDRLGLTASEVRKAERYRSIVAFPLVREGDSLVLGVLSIDCSTPEQFACIRAATERDAKFLDIRSTCENHLANGP